MFIEEQKTMFAVGEMSFHGDTINHSVAPKKTTTRQNINCISGESSKKYASFKNRTAKIMRPI